MKSWQRSKPCNCSGYWFPHRLKSGTCVYNPNGLNALRLLAKRYSWTQEEFLDAMLEYVFDNKGIVSDKCPF